jgi:hypothetical protein
MATEGDSLITSFQAAQASMFRDSAAARPEYQSCSGRIRARAAVHDRAHKKRAAEMAANMSSWLGPTRRVVMPVALATIRLLSSTRTNSFVRF